MLNKYVLNDESSTWSAVWAVRVNLLEFVLHCLKTEFSAATLMDLSRIPAYHAGHLYITYITVDCPDHTQQAEPCIFLIPALFGAALRIL